MVSVTALLRFVISRSPVRLRRVAPIISSRLQLFGPHWPLKCFHFVSIVYPVHGLAVPTWYQVPVCVAGHLDRAMPKLLLDVFERDSPCCRSSDANVWRRKCGFRCATPALEGSLANTLRTLDPSIGLLAIVEFKEGGMWPALETAVQYPPL